MMCMDMKAAMQFGLTGAGGVGVEGVVGQSASWRLEPAKPPMRVCTSQMPDGEPRVARLYSIRVAPAWVPWVLEWVLDGCVSGY